MQPASEAAVQNQISKKSRKKPGGRSVRVGAH